MFPTIRKGGKGRVQFGSLCARPADASANDPNMRSEINRGCITPPFYARAPPRATNRFSRTDRVLRARRRKRRQELDSMQGVVTASPYARSLGPGGSQLAQAAF